MSIVVTPTLNATETFQVATPFSYSFTYPTVIQTSDPPQYFYSGKTVNDGTNSSRIKFITDLNPIKVTGLTYTVSNMSALNTARELEGDVLECVLPIVYEARYSYDVGSFVTFGGPTSLSIEGGIPGADADPTVLGYFATFTGVGKFAYGLDDSTEDSLQYIPLAATPGTTGPAVSFKIKLLRPQNDYASVKCDISANVMTVSDIYGQLYGGGQVTVGMIFPVQGGPSGLTRAFTVTSYISSTEPTGHYGGNGTYGITPNDGGAALTAGPFDPIVTNYVAGSGDVLLSNSMTPSDGTIQFNMNAPWTFYTRPPAE
jgi:hypothetical protein